jgi:hypothetical protein
MKGVPSAPQVSSATSSTSRRPPEPQSERSATKHPTFGCEGARPRHCFLLPSHRLEERDHIWGAQRHPDVVRIVDQRGVNRKKHVGGGNRRRIESQLNFHAWIREQDARARHHPRPCRRCRPGLPIRGESGAAGRRSANAPQGSGGREFLRSRVRLLTGGPLSHPLMFSGASCPARQSQSIAPQSARSCKNTDARLPDSRR